MTVELRVGWRVYCPWTGTGTVVESRPRRRGRRPYFPIVMVLFDGAELATAVNERNLMIDLEIPEADRWRMTWSTNNG